MNIVVNGKIRQLDGVKTLHELIHKSLKNTSHVVAERNGEIINRAQWPHTPLTEGDRLELVSLVAGG